MKLYSVTAMVAYHKGKWQGSQQVPAFLLSDRQVTDLDDAKALAEQIVDPLGTADAVFVHVVEL